MAEPPAPGLRLRQRVLAALWRLESPAGLAGLYVVAFALRILLAPHIGFFGDLRYFTRWADRLNDVGFGGFYEPGYFADYPPGYLYVLRFIGAADPDPGYLSLKLPTIVADLALAWIAAEIAVRLASDRLRRRLPVRAAVSLAVLASPAVIGVGALWGQVDSIPSTFVLGSLLVLLTRPRRRTSTPAMVRDMGGMALFAVAIAMKPQSGFLVPVIGYILLRRYVLNVRPADRGRGALRLLGAVGPAIGLWAVSGVPFGLSPTGLVSFYRQSAEVLPVTSANAFNLWGAVGFFRGDADYWNELPPITVAGVSAVNIGLLLFLAGTTGVLVATHRMLRRGVNEAASTLWASAAVSMLAFTVLTRMHERYMFPVLALLAPLVVLRPFRRFYVATSLLFTVNLWFPFAYFNSGWQVRDLVVQPWFTWFFGDVAALDSPQRKFWSGVGVALCAILVVGGPRWLARSHGLRAEGTWTIRRAMTRLAATLGSTPSTPATSTPATPTPATRRSLVGRFAPLGVVAAVVGWWLIALRGELRAVRTLNDTTFHMQMVRWAVGQLHEGRLALDGWFPDLALGSSFFHHYQSLPYNITALVSEIVPGDADSTFRWTAYLLLATWPLVMYTSVRLFELDRWVAAAVAVIAPLVVSQPGYGYEFGSYIFAGYGVYTQLFGMWLLPLAWATTWRALHGRGNIAWAVLALAFTIATHLMTGYLAIVTVAAIALASPARRTLARAALVLVGSVITAAWVLVPLVADRNYSAQSEYYVGSIFNDSFGAGTIMGWLVSGSLFDEGRLPIITVLAAIGAVVCISRWRVDSRCRSLLLLLGTSLALYFGRTTWGALTDLLPGAADLQMHRFVSGVHLAGVILAGIGLVTCLRLLGDLIDPVLRRSTLGPPAIVRYVVIALVAALVLRPPVGERTDYTRMNNSYITSQRASDAGDGADVDRLIDEIVRRGDGRGYSGLRGNWGADYRVGEVPVLQEYSHRDVDALGFTFRTVQSLSTDIEVGFDDTNLAQYEMLNVKYLIFPEDRVPSVPATLLASSGRHRLFEVQTSGYITVVDREGVIEADRTDLSSRTESFRGSSAALEGRYPGVVFNGEGTAPDTVPATGATGRPGTVVEQAHDRSNGDFTARVTMDRTGVVLLKASYDPRWRVTVDGERRPIEMMAPSLVGVDVGPGEHEIRFDYENYPHYPLLLGLGASCVAALGILDRRHPRLLRRPRP